MTWVMLRRILGHRADGDAPGHAQPVTVTIADGPPGPVVPDDFAGLSFERGPRQRTQDGDPARPGQGGLRKFGALLGDGVQIGCASLALRAYRQL
jgi:hypothetical protein